MAGMFLSGTACHRSSDPSSSSSPHDTIAILDVELIKPEGFQQAKNFQGLEEPETGSSLVVLVVGQPYTEVVATFTAENMQTAGMVLAERTAVPVGSEQGVLFRVHQLIEGVQLLKWVLVFGNPQKTAVVSATIPTSSEAALSTRLKETVLSARWRRAPPMSDVQQPVTQPRQRSAVSLLEFLGLAIFWIWVLTAAIFLRNTILPQSALPASPRLWGLPTETVRFQATDGIWLSGWIIVATPTHPWVILCHGLGTNRADVLEIAAPLFRAGYNVLLFDFRAHGESQGKVTSFGWREQRDLEGALAFLGTQAEVPERPYGVFGISMGGAVAMMVAARDERIGAVAVDSVYTSLENSIGQHLSLLYRLPRVPFLWFTNFAYRMRFSVWPSRVSPIRGAPKISPRGLFIIHGREDVRTPVHEAQALFEAARQPKDLWLVDGARHLEGLHVNPEVYLSRLIEFFDSHLKK